MSDSISSYFEYTQKPWGKLFYDIALAQLSFACEMKILDFGSGFGITAGRLAEYNDVTAVEPSAEMCAMRPFKNGYRQITGGIDALEEFPSESFDMVLCHNVLEYINDRDKYIDFFSRLLKKGGLLSVIKHNRDGKIMHKAVFDSDPGTALAALEGQAAESRFFGEISHYEMDVVQGRAGFSVRDIYGIRAFFGLIQNNDIKYGAEWQRKMLELEIKASGIETFRNVAFFHHVILEKNV